MADVKWSNNASFPVIAVPDDADLIVGLYTNNGGKNGKITALNWVNSYLNQKITVDLSANVTGTLPTVNGGTGQTAYTDGQLLIGKTDGTLAANTLTAGAGILIENTDGGIKVESTSGDPVLQQTYDNSPDGDINLSAGKDFMLSSSVAGFRTTEMTNAQFQLIASPLNGLQAWSNTDDRPIYNRGTAVTPDYVLGAYLSDIESALDNLAYGSMNFQSNPTETIIAAINTYVKVNSPYASGSLKGFSQAAGTLTYLDTETRVVQVICSLSSKLPLTTASLEYAIFINGVLFPQSQSTSFSGGVTDSPIATTIIAQPELNTGDTIEIFVRNNSGTDNVIVESLNCTVGTIGASGTGTSNTLEEAYVAGDGSMTMESGKPVAILSNDNNSNFIPTLNLEQLQIPATNQVLANYNVKSKNSAGDVIDYSRMYTQIRNTTAGNESSRVDYFAYAAGLNKLYMRFDGDDLTAGIGGTLALNTGVTLNNHNLYGVVNFTQELGNATFNNSLSNVSNFLVKVPGTLGLSVDYATATTTLDTPLSMNGNAISNVENIQSGTTGVSIASTNGMTGAVITYQSWTRVGNEVSLNLGFNFTADASFQPFLSIDVPFTANNFSGLNEAGGGGSVTRVATLLDWNGAVSAVLSQTGTQSIQINTILSDSISLYKTSVQLTYTIV